jgi:hypothetical protein
MGPSARTMVRAALVALPDSSGSEANQQPW